MLQLSLLRDWVLFALCRPVVDHMLARWSFVTLAKYVDPPVCEYMVPPSVHLMCCWWCIDLSITLCG